MAGADHRELDVQAVVVPLDGSDYAERAIRPAKLVAARTGAGIGVVQVVTDESKVDRDYLTSVVDEYRLAWREVVIDDDAANGILVAADLRNALVCMATHGHGRAAAIFGSTAVKVLTQSPDPIVLIGREVDTTRLRLVARIVIALDGTDDSERVCDPAIRWARQFGLVAELVTVAGEPFERLSDDAPIRRAFGPHDPQAYIGAAVQRYQTLGVEVVGRALIDPISPASGIAHWLREGRDAVLAMATHGRTGVERLIRRSNAGRILDESPVPAVMFAIRPTAPA